MNDLNPQPPFIWPEPRVLEKMCEYAHWPPYCELAHTSQSIFGIVCALSGMGIDVLSSWLEQNQQLKARLVVAVYPTCTTRPADLSRLLQIVQQMPSRIEIHIYPLESVTDRGTNALCFVTPNPDVVYIATGPSENLGLYPRLDGHANFVFRADPVLVEAFKRHFVWLWGNSRDIAAQGTVSIPVLMLPDGSTEAARRWDAYRSERAGLSLFPDESQPVACVDPGTGEVTLKTQDGRDLATPTEDLGLKKLDPLAEWMARLYEKGALVSIDKLSRIPPLDAPVDPSLFGDAAELQTGNVTRRVNMRVSVFDESTLKGIEKRRQGLRTLLTRFTYALADNMRWMPFTARELFESELERIDKEGQKLISSLLQGDVEEFVNGRRSDITRDINAMYKALGRQGQVPEDVIAKVARSLRDRLSKAKSATFMPKLSYSSVSFTSTENTFASPWGQAYSLLADIATFPRKIQTDSFFLRDIEVSQDELVEVMNVAGDVVCSEMRSRGIKGRCKADLTLLDKVEGAHIDSRDRCELVQRLLSGDSVEAIEETIKQKESA